MIGQKGDGEQDTKRQIMPRSLVENPCFPLYITKGLVYKVYLFVCFGI